MTKWHTRIACWIPKATNTHSEYVMFIPFLMQQRLHERASMLRHTYIAYLVEICSPLVHRTVKLTKFLNDSLSKEEMCRT